MTNKLHKKEIIQATEIIKEFGIKTLRTLS